MHHLKKKEQETPCTTNKIPFYQLKDVYAFGKDCDGKIIGPGLFRIQHWNHKHICISNNSEGSVWIEHNNCWSNEEEFNKAKYTKHTRPLFSESSTARPGYPLNKRKKQSGY